MHKSLKILLGVILFILWLVGSTVMGSVFLAARDALGWNVFTNSGFHALTACLVQEGEKVINKQ